MSRNSITSSVLIAAMAFTATATAIAAKTSTPENAHAAHVREWRASQATASQRSQLVVEVVGVQPGTGAVLVGLYDSRTEFPHEGKHLTTRRVSVSSSSTKAVFADVPHGNYAVAVIHDRNDNGKLDMRLGMLPAEPFGVSKSASARFGPPQYHDAAFRVDEPDKSIIVRLR